MIRIDSAQAARSDAVTTFSLDSDYGSMNESGLENVRQFLDKNRGANVVLNFSRTRIIGASFLGILAQASGRNCAIALVGLNGLCKEAFGPAKLGALFDEFRTHQDAIEAISPHISHLD